MTMGPIRGFRGPIRGCWVGLSLEHWIAEHAAGVETLS